MKNRQSRKIASSFFSEHRSNRLSLNLEYGCMANAYAAFRPDLERIGGHDGNFGREEKQTKPARNFEFSLWLAVCAGKEADECVSGFVSALSFFERAESAPKDSEPAGRDSGSGGGGGAGSSSNDGVRVGAFIVIQLANFPNRYGKLEACPQEPGEIQ